MIPGSILSDAWLVRRVLSGRRDDYGVLVKRHLRTVRGLTFAWLRNDADADDATQEAFVRAYESLNSLRAGDRFDAWLAAIARNVCFKVKAKQVREAEVIEQAKRLTPESELPTHDRHDLLETVRKTVLSLEEESREVLILYYYSEKDTREIAGVLGISVEASKKRLQRAREALGRRLIDGLEPALRPQQQEDKRIAQIMGIVGQAAPLWQISATAPGLAGKISTLVGGYGIMKALIAVLGISVGIVLVPRAADRGAVAPESVSESLTATSEEADPKALGEAVAGLDTQAPVIPENGTPNRGLITLAQSEPAPPVQSGGAYNPPAGRMSGANRQHTNYFDVPSILEEPEVAWQVELGDVGALGGVQPILDDSQNVYLNFRSGDIDRFASFNSFGQLRWMGAPIASNWRAMAGPAFLPNGDIVMLWRDGALRATDSNTGETKWTAPIMSRLNENLGPTSCPAVDSQGAVYVGGRWDDDVFVKVSATGEELWRTEIANGEMSGGGGASSAALSHDEATVYIGWDEKVGPEVLNIGAGGLYALDAGDGHIKWQFRESLTERFAAAWCSPTVGADGTIYQQDAASGKLFALADMGSSAMVKWTYSPDAPGDAPRMLGIDSEALYISTLGEAPVVCALNLDGTMKWFRAFDRGDECATPTVTRDAIYVPAVKIGLVCLDKRNGDVLWTKAADGAYVQMGEAVAVAPNGTIFWAITDWGQAKPILMALRQP